MLTISIPILFLYEYYFYANTAKYWQNAYWQVQITILVKYESQYWSHTNHKKNKIIQIKNKTNLKQ